MLRRSVEEFGAYVSQIRDDQWEAGWLSIHDSPPTRLTLWQSDGPSF